MEAKIWAGLGWAGLGWAPGEALKGFPPPTIRLYPPGRPSEPDQASPAQPGPTRPSPAQPSPAQKSHTSNASSSQKAPSNDKKMTTNSFIRMHVRIQPIATEMHKNAFSAPRAHFAAERRRAAQSGSERRSLILATVSQSRISKA